MYMEDLKEPFSDYKIVFCYRERAIEEYDSATIELSPVSTEWNDFKYKCIYQYRIIAPNAKTIIGQLFLGFIKGSDYIEENGKLKPDVTLVEADKLPDFFTLQGGMGEYRSIVSKFSPTVAKAVLLVLNDLVVLNATSKSPMLVSRALNTNVFALGFMRDNERFFAFHNAYSLLDVTFPRN